MTAASPIHPRLPPRLAGDDPFRRSLLGRSAGARLLAAAAALVPFWLAVAWAVSVP